MQHQNIPADWVAVLDYQNAAKTCLPPETWAYLQGGSDRSAQTPNGFDQYQLLPRPLRDLRHGHSRLELFGQTLPHPFLLAPVAYQRLFHPLGESATALAAQVSQTPMIVSHLACMTLENIAQHHQPACFWFQLYWQGCREQLKTQLHQIRQAGYQAIVLTVDAPHMGIRTIERRAGFTLPPEIQAVNFRPIQKTQPHPTAQGLFDGLMAHAPDWSDVAWLVQHTDLPVLLKGILHPDDARRAVDLGVQGVIVSNHGGRVLDGVVDGLRMLPQIRAATPVSIPVLYDGGIRCGADAFKALALGATALLIGRAYIYGLAAAGALGVAHVIKLLREELEVCMALCGTAQLHEISQDYLIKACKNVE